MAEDKGLGAETGVLWKEQQRVSRGIDGRGSRGSLERKTRTNLKNVSKEVSSTGDDGVLLKESKRFGQDNDKGIVFERRKEMIDSP